MFYDLIQVIILNVILFILLGASNVFIKGRNVHVIDLFVSLILLVILIKNLLLY